MPISKATLKPWILSPGHVDAQARHWLRGARGTRCTPPSAPSMRRTTLRLPLLMRTAAPCWTWPWTRPQGWRR